jgi:hypothetical protein
MAGAIASHRRLLGTAPGARLLAIRAFSTQAASSRAPHSPSSRGSTTPWNNGVRIVTELRRTARSDHRARTRRRL